MNTAQADTPRSPATTARLMESSGGLATRHGGVLLKVQAHSVVVDMIHAARRPDQSVASFLREAAIQVALERLEASQEA